MKALILSDSHGDIKALERIIQANIHDVRHVFHTGDGCDDMAVFVSRYPDVSFHIVAGNCDMSANFPRMRIVEISTKAEPEGTDSALKIMMAHGHKYSVKTSYDRLCYAALEAGVNICLFGHTHTPVDFEYEGVRFINPGAVFQRGGGVPRYAVVDFK